MLTYFYRTLKIKQMAKVFIKFFPKDWGNDVKPLSLTARGLLIELIILLAKNKGTITLDILYLKRSTGGTTKEINKALNEFKKHNILDFKIDDLGTHVKSRKIIKGISKSLINKENGKNGGNPSLKKESQPLNRKESQPLNQNVQQLVSEYGKNKDQEHQEDNKLDTKYDTKSNTKPDTKLNNPSGFNPLYISIEKLESVLLQEVSWQEDVCRVHKIGKTTLPEWINKFVLKIKADDVKGIIISEAKRYFNNWIKIELKNIGKTDIKHTRMTTRLW
jgi:hypothetical protein